MSLENSVVWIKNSFVPRMLDEIPKWKGAVLISCEITPMELNKDGFASLLFATNLCLNLEGKQESHSLIVKIMLFDEKLRAAFQSKKQFANEIHFYSTVIPSFESIAEGRLNIESLFPKYYYSYMTSEDKCAEEDGVLVLENLKPRGFRLGNRTSLDFEHCIVALQQIGRYHALSYALKHLHQETFFREVISKVHETVQSSGFCRDVVTYNKRVTEALKALTQDTLAETLEHKISDPTVFENFITPKEPLAVLCHGDFCRNNILFNYNDDNKPCEAKLLDFQTIRYASPAIDLSFFLFMNTTAELRKQYWDRLFEIYHREVCSSLAKLLGKPEDSLDPCYSLQAFKDDFRQHALYGYMITVTFLPCMLSSDEEREEMCRGWTDTMADTFTSPAMEEIINKIGGAKATDELVVLVHELKDKSFL